MDLVGPLLIAIVLTFGVFYATSSLWIVWQEIRKHARVAKFAAFPASMWFQHTTTLLVSLVFLGVAGSLCVSIAQSESCTKVVEALKAFTSQKTTGNGMTWGETGHHGSLHVTSLPEGECVTGASLCYMEFDNSDLKQIVEQYPHIRWLILSGTQIDDRAMKLLAQKKNLSALAVTDTLITDRGLALLEGHGGLEDLDLTRTAITDRSLTIVNSLSALRHLHLCETKVTDAGLRALKGNTTLRTLNIAGTPISDAAVTALTTLKSLDTLHVQGSQLSPGAIVELQRALPECRIFSGNSDDPVARAPDGSIVVEHTP